MNIDPDTIFHQDAIEMVRSNVLREQRWLVQLQKEQQDGYERTDYIAKQQLIVNSLSDMADYAAERRMLATIRWVYNTHAAALMSEGPSHPWSGLSGMEAAVVRDAINDGKVLKSEHRDVKQGMGKDLRLAEFTDPTLGPRWAVMMFSDGIVRYITDHPTEFDADTRFQALLTITESLE